MAVDVCVDVWEGEECVGDGGGDGREVRIGWEVTPVWVCV